MTGGPGKTARRILGRAVVLLAEQEGADRSDPEGVDRLEREVLANRSVDGLEAILEDPGFAPRAWSLAFRILDRAEAALATGFFEALSLALIARRVSSRVGSDEEAPERKGLVGRAYCVMGEAERLRGHLLGAETCLLRDASKCFEALPAGSVERAVFCLCLARLRWDQRRVEEALALAARAVERFEIARDLRRASEARLDLAWMLLEAGEPLEALPHFQRLAVAGVIAESDFARWLRLRQGLALAQAELGRCEAAREVLKEVAAVAKRQPRREQLRSLVVEAEVGRRLEDHAQAEAKLDEAWPELLALGEVQDALLALVERAELHVEVGEWAEILSLANRLAVAGERAGSLAEEVRAALGLAGWGLESRELLASLKVSLRRKRRHPAMGSRRVARKPPPGFAEPAPAQAGEEAVR